MEIMSSVLRPEEAVALQLRGLYEGQGFQPFRLNSFEEYNFYLEKKNFLADADVIKFNSGDGRLLALNPDVTLSIVKNTPNGEQRRVYYNENVYRHDRKTGDYRQLNQIGVEVIGSVDQEAELAIIQLALESLAVMGTGKLEISHSEIIAGILEQFPESTRGAVFRSLKNKNFEELMQLAATAQLSAQLTESIATLMKLSGPLTAVLPQAIAASAEMPQVQGAFQELQAFADQLAPGQTALDFDLSTVNDTTYYSGIIFQGFLQEVPQAILFGGRYDGLLASLDKKQSAIGFGIYLDLIEQTEELTEKELSVVNVALPKGRMGEKVYQMFTDAGLCAEELLDDSRKLVFYDEASNMRFFLVKPSDVAAYVEHGAADIGVVGRDTLLETQGDVIDLLKLGIGECRIVMAGPKTFKTDSSRPLKIATKYPNITRKYFGERSQPVELIYLNGSIELAPIVGLSDVIVDIVETGTTLKENDLAVLQEITDSAAHLVVNRASWRFKKDQISEIVEKVSEINDKDN